MLKKTTYASSCTDKTQVKESKKLNKFLKTVEIFKIPFIIFLKLLKLDANSNTKKNEIKIPEGAKKEVLVTKTKIQTKIGPKLPKSD